MGSDIHGVFQKKQDMEWVDVPTQYEFSRHYYLFAVLAGVRNGYGFAGVPIFKPVVPIAEQRGLPADFICIEEMHPIDESIADKYELEYKEDGLNRWMGDHSHSWLSDNELLGYKQQASWKCGYVERSVFDAWDGVSRPESYSGGISGNSIITADSPVEVEDDTTHVRIFWLENSDLAYFFDEVKRLKELHGTIRFVFGFDS